MITKKISFNNYASKFTRGKTILGTLIEYRIFGILIYKKEFVSPQVTMPDLADNFEIITHL